MAWRMPAETAPHERTWMAFPRTGLTLGHDAASAEEAYSAWTAVAHAVAEFEPVSMVVDPSERERAARMLGSGIEQIEAPLDEFWMRDVGPTFVLDEGGAIVEGAFPGVTVPVAAVGVSEKGSTTLRLVVDQQGGHASTPP